MASDSATAASASANIPASAIDVLEERLIDAEYRTWKKNTPFLYDFVITHSLEWPSLTCQWLPTVRNGNEHSLLVGTHTTGEQNYLMVASCVIPCEEPVVDTEASEAENKPNAKSMNGKSTSSGATAGNTNTSASSIRYDEDKKEVGGYGLAQSQMGKIEIKMKIPHQGEVHRARYMPQNPFVVASRGPAPEVYIFDLSKHSSFPTPISSGTNADDSYLFAPQGICVGHASEGYGMVWNPQKAGHLCTCSDDHTVRLWDVNAVTAVSHKETGTQITSTAVLVKNGHTDVVEDVDWHWKDANLLCSVGDDRRLILWDLNTNKTVHKVENAHEDDIMSVAFNPVQEFLLATGSADKKIQLWDIRNMSKPIYTMLGHNNQIYQLSWSPFNECILGSCSADRRVAVWDMSRIGMEQTPEDAEDGPPELLFLHAGHTNRVSDFSWNSKDLWTIASVSEENVLQVWKMTEDIYAEEEDDDNEQSDGEENGLLGDDDLE